MSDFPHGVALGVLPAPADTLPAPHVVAAPITAQYAVAPEHYLMRLRDVRVAQGAPGQFVMIKPTRAADLHPILPRPMAVYRYLPASDEFEIVYRVIGTGTRVLSERTAGEAAELVGPVGQPFRLAGLCDGLLVIGRGIGTCSVTSAAEAAAARGARVYAVVSARRPDALIGLDLFAELGAQVFAVTDAERTSAPEWVAEQVAPLLRLGRVQQVLVCGSNRLIDLAVRLAAPHGVDVQVSLEAHMACGIGYCHGCSHGAVGESEEAPLVCREGPVFRATRQLTVASRQQAAPAKAIGR
ncbi:MAG TPA: dihydroorotate oxidase electron transfer subunit [Chloroflexota bacterium]|jgi:dihydroorotate dehydrogenase electron transfer subunit